MSRKWALRRGVRVDGSGLRSSGGGGLSGCEWAVLVLSSAVFAVRVCGKGDAGGLRLKHRAKCGIA